METILLHPENKEQLEAIKIIAKALKMKFEIHENPSFSYNTDFATKIKQGDEDLKKGKGKSITIEELDSLWK